MSTGYFFTFGDNLCADLKLSSIVPSLRRDCLHLDMFTVWSIWPVFICDVFIFSAQHLNTVTFFEFISIFLRGLTSPREKFVLYATSAPWTLLLTCAHCLADFAKLQCLSHPLMLLTAQQLFSLRDFIFCFTTSIPYVLRQFTCVLLLFTSMPRQFCPLGAVVMACDGLPCLFVHRDGAHVAVCRNVMVDCPHCHIACCLATFLEWNARAAHARGLVRNRGHYMCMAP